MTPAEKLIHMIQDKNATFGKEVAIAEVKNQFGDYIWNIRIGPLSCSGLTFDEMIERSWMYFYDKGEDNDVSMPTL